MAAIGVTLLICCTVLLLAHIHWPLLDRLLSILEQRAAKENEPPRPQEAVSIPRDLYQLALAYEDAWARDQALQAMREMYAEHGSWDVVRVTYGIASRDSG